MSSTSAHEMLDALDAAMLQTWRVLQLPAYRRRVLASLGSDLSLATLRILRGVERAGGENGPSVGEVAELLGIDPSTASRAVEDAVTRGLLQRRVCTTDRRRQRLQLTHSGVELLDRANTVRREVLAEVTAGWATGDVADLTHRLSRLTEEFTDRLGTV